MIGSSNRGGRRIRKRTIDEAGLDGDAPSSARRNTFSHPSALPSREDHPNTSLNEYRTESTPTISTWDGDNYGTAQHGRPVTSPTPGMMLDPALQQGSDPNGRGMLDRNSSGSENIAFNDLQNPSDALGILAQIASHGESKCGFSTQRKSTLTFIDAHHYSSSHGMSANYRKSQLDYALVRNGRLSYSKIITLLQRYKHYYHPYFPLVPAATLDAVNLSKTAVEEPHLLTAILVIASRDLTDEPHLFVACAEHMRALVSALAAGGPGNVEAVEVCNRKPHLKPTGPV